MTTRRAWGLGLATVTDDGNTLDVWYPRPILGDEPADGDADLLTTLSAMESKDAARGVHTTVVRSWADLDDAPKTVAGAYLRLHILSHRLALPNTVNLDGVFSRLPNVVWTSVGPCAAEDFEVTRTRLRAKLGHAVQVDSVDKFPRMTDYVLPSGVRIGNAANVRLGAYLSEGTTVMHSGFVNYNAGTLGRSMVEGRVSQGVVIGDGSDVGGGASTMGMLSGGGLQRVALGERCLLGANSGLGIPLGDDCVVALQGVGSLFGFLKVKEVVDKLAPKVKGRLLVFFPGSYEDNNYRLLDGYDGWNYLAVPITADKEF